MTNTPNPTGDKPMVTLDAQDRKREALIVRLGAFADLLCQEPLPGASGDVAYDLLRQAAAQIASDRQHIARHREQETLSREQPLDALQRLGQEFEQPTPTSRYYFCTADKTWYAKPCGDPWCRDANYQPKQGECNR